MASPHVSGLAALILSKHDGFSNEMVRGIIRSSADDVDVPGWDIYSGYGRINAFNALGYNTALVVTITSPTHNSIVTGTISIEGTAAGPLFDSWILEYGEGVTPDSGPWTEIASSTSQVTEEVLGFLDTTLIKDGLHTLRLRATDTFGHTFRDRVLITTDNYFCEITYPEASNFFRIGEILTIIGTAPDGNLQNYKLEWGQGEGPTTWSTDGIILENDGTQPITSGTLGYWDTSFVPTSGYYTIKLTLNAFGVTDADRDQVTIHLDNYQEGWPQKTQGVIVSCPAVVDLDNDGKQEIVIGSKDKKVYVWNYDGTPRSGWPKTTEGTITSCPAIGDIDGVDGLEIVVFSNDNRVYVWKPDGTSLPQWPVKVLTGSTDTTYVSPSPVLADMDNDGLLEIIVTPIDTCQIFVLDGDGTTLWSQTVCTGTPPVIYSTPAVGDIDNDGYLEIVTASRWGWYYALNHDGSVVLGWPKHTTGTWASSPALADLDGDGYLEIIVGMWYHIMVWRYDEDEEVWEVMDDWPQDLKFDGVLAQIESSPAIGDLDGVGDLEIVVGNSLPFPPHTDLNAYHHNGSIVSGWPIEVGSATEYSIKFASPILGDIDGDGNIEVVTGEDYPIPISMEISAYNYDGSPVSNWPKKTKGIIRHASALGDIDGDGDIEVVAGASDGRVYVWDLPDAYDHCNIEWGTFHHDNRRTGYYPIATEITITSPSTSACINSSTVVVEGTIEDRGAGVEFIIVDGITATITGDTFTAILMGVPDGSLNITATVTDLYCNINSHSVNITIDTAPPAAPTVTPPDGEYCVGEPITVTTAEGGSEHCTTDGSAPDCASPATITANMTLRCIECDGCNNLGAETVRNYTVDTVAVVTITSPPDNAILGIADDLDPLSTDSLETIVTVSTDAEDGQTVTITVNGATTYEGSVIAGTAVIEVSLPYCQNTIAADVKDNCNNPAISALVNVTADLNTPMINIVSPLPGECINILPVVVTGDYSDTCSGISIITVDGVTATLTGTPPFSGTFTASLYLGEGPSDISATAVDYANNSATTPTISITVDTIPPLISITSPLNLSFLNSSDDNDSDPSNGLQTDITVSTDAEDGQGVTLIVNDVSSFTGVVSAGEVVFTNITLPEGLDWLRASVSDHCGNTSTFDIVIVFVDSQGPLISSTTELPNTTDGVGPYVVTSTITDPSGVLSAFLIYSFDGGVTTTAVIMPNVGDEYTGEIVPAAPLVPGTVVTYYIEAVDNFDNISRDPENAPAETFRFAILSCEPLAYISNVFNNLVTILDTGTRLEVGRIPVGLHPWRIAVTPNDRFVYVANLDSDTVSVIESASENVVATVTVGDHPEGLAITPDGKKVYVANRFSNNISVIETETNEVVKTIPIPIPYEMAITPDGTRMYVCSGFGWMYTYVIDTASDVVIEVIDVSGGVEIAFTPDGKKAYIIRTASTVVVLDTDPSSPDYHTVLKVISIDVNSLVDIVTALTPNGPRAYATNHFSDVLLVFNTDTDEYIKKIPVGSAWGLDISSLSTSGDGQFVYVACENTIAVISTATNEVVYVVNMSLHSVEIAVQSGLPQITDTTAAYASPHTVTATITDNSRIVSASLFYSTDADFTEIPMVNIGGDLYSALIPDQPFCTTIKYYIQAIDDCGNVVTDPVDAPISTYEFKVISPEPPLSHVVTITGVTSGDALGYGGGINRAGSALDAGDINGDGFNEIIISASHLFYGYGSGSALGKVYIFYGDGPITSGSASTADTIIVGEEIGDAFGGPVKVIGDLNGDGLNELAVSARHYGPAVGSVYVFYGSTTPFPSNMQAVDADIIIRGENSELLGKVAVGDLNDDDIPDLIVGGPWNSSVFSHAGAIHVFYGPVASGIYFSNQAQVNMYGKEDHDYLGGISIGDLNEDGIDDLAVSAHRGGAKPGQCYIFYGSDTGIPDNVDSAAVTFSAPTPQAGDYFGAPIDMADFNGDDIADLVVGSYGKDNYNGAVYVYYGAIGGIPTVPGTILTAETPGDIFGWNLDGDGDINGDGYEDLLVGAWHYEGGGAAYVFYGGPLGIPSVSGGEADLIFRGFNPGDDFGRGVAGLGDINGDCLGDVGFGAPGNDNIGGANAGAVYIYY